MKSKKLISTIVIVCIIAAIVSIAVFKNMQDSPDTNATSGNNLNANSQGGGQTTLPGSETESSANSHFALEVERIDLEELKAHGLPLIIDFGADECAPCKQMAPLLKDLNAEMQGKALITFIDVWQNPDGFAGFPIQLIPTQAFYDANGNPYVPSSDIDIDLMFYHDKITDEHIYTLHQGGLTEEQMRVILADMGVR